MQIQKSKDCKTIFVVSDQIRQMLDTGSVEYITVDLTYNCCKTETITVVPGLSECEWEVSGDTLVPSILFTGQLMDGVTRIRGFWRPGVDDPYESVILVDGLYDMTEPSEVSQLIVDVETWMANNSVSGDFSVEFSDGEGEDSIFTLKFENLSSNFFPWRYQTEPQASGLIPNGNILDAYFSCDGSVLTTIGNIPNVEVMASPSGYWAITATGLELYAPLMGTEQFPDGVYGIDLKVVSEDGTSVSISECLLMDCGLACKIADMKSPDAAFYYYLLKDLQECDCDCSMMCEILTLQIEGE